MLVNKKKRAAQIKKILDEYFPEVPIPLDHKDAFTLLIAVMLSAQCTDERVNKVTPALFKKANTPEKMAELSVAQITEYIKTCGLTNTKAKALKRTAELLVEKHHGKVPCSFEELEALPGVGHKTASVVMSQAFGKPAFPVDTHIHRCAHRWGLSNGKNVVQTEKDLKQCFAKKDWNKIHLQIIYFARKFCTARLHNVENCPVCKTLVD